MYASSSPVVTVSSSSTVAGKLTRMYCYALGHIQVVSSVSSLFIGNIDEEPTLFVKRREVCLSVDDLCGVYQRKSLNFQILTLVVHTCNCAEFNPFSTAELLNRSLMLHSGGRQKKHKEKL